MTFEELQHKIAKKFGLKELVIKYQATTGQIKAIHNQKSMDEALSSPSLKELYVHLPGEKNEFIPSIELTPESW